MPGTASWPVSNFSARFSGGAVLAFTGTPARVRRCDCTKFCTKVLCCCCEFGGAQADPRIAVVGGACCGWCLREQFGVA